MQKLGEIIKEYRERNKLSLRDFSNLCNLSHTYIDKLEKGKDPRNGKAVEPTLDALEKISLALNLTLDELLLKLGKIGKNVSSQIENDDSLKTTQSLNPIFTKRLRELIQEKKISLDILSQKVKIELDLLYKYENNLTSPKSDDIVKLANYFDVTTDYLLGTTLVRNHIDTVAAHKANPHKDLPEEAQEQLNDYIEFLMNKYKK